eukprot:5335128-Alexandrium_andersonii.AAC.1
MPTAHRFFQEAPKPSLVPNDVWAGGFRNSRTYGCASLSPGLIGLICYVLLVFCFSLPESTTRGRSYKRGVFCAHALANVGSAAYAQETPGMAEK